MLQITDKTLEESIQITEGQDPGGVMPITNAHFLRLNQELLEARKRQVEDKYAFRPKGSLYKLGDTVQKRSGSKWHGTIVGYYTTELTPIGYAVESYYEKGSVQIYPQVALIP